MDEDSAAIKAIDLDAVVEDETPDEPEEKITPDTPTDEPATEEESEEDSEESADDEEEPKEETFQKRFPRFKGETLEEYVKNLEEGYANSSTEAVRLARELKEKAAVEEQPALPADPIIDWAKAERDRQWKAEWKEFSAKHPEVEQDDTLFAEFDKRTADMFGFIQNTEGRVPTLGEAMQKAWLYMNPDGDVSREEKLALTAKSAGAGSKSKGGIKEKPKSKYTDSQIEMAIKFDPSLKDRPRAEVEELLDKYKKV